MNFLSSVGFLSQRFISIPLTDLSLKQVTFSAAAFSPVSKQKRESVFSPSKASSSFVGFSMNNGCKECCCIVWGFAILALLPTFAKIIPTDQFRTFGRVGIGPRGYS